MRARNRDVEKTAAYNESRRRGSGLNSFLAGVATVLVLLLAAGGFLLYRAMEEGMVTNPFDPQTNKRNSPPAPPGAGEPASQTARGSAAIKPGQFQLPAFTNKAEVELVSVKRILGRPDEVSVQMRVHRMGDNFLASDTINVGATTASHPATRDFYEAVDPAGRSSGSISLKDMRTGQSVDGYVVLKVPQTVSALDIVVNNVGPFANVPISTADSVALPPNGSAAKPSSGTPTPGTTSTPGTTTPAANVGIQPGQFVKLAYGDKAQVELLSVQRIKDPQTSNRDVVNVQMRIRRRAPEVDAAQVIGVGETTARNPDTTETYKAIDAAKRSTGLVDLSTIRKDASVDAYVWLRVPEGVKTLNIYVPQTAAFNKVPISE